MARRAAPKPSRWPSGSCTCSLRIMFRDLSPSVCSVCMSRSRALQSGFRGFALLVRLRAHVARAAPDDDLYSYLHALGLRPRRHAKRSHLSQGPQVLSQSCRRGHSRLPTPFLITYPWRNHLVACYSDPVSPLLLIARPAASRPTVTGDICRRPSRRQVASTALSCSRRNCCATAISMRSYPSLSGLLGALKQMYRNRLSDRHGKNMEHVR